MAKGVSWAICRTPGIVQWLQKSIHRSVQEGGSKLSSPSSAPAPPPDDLRFVPLILLVAPLAAPERRASISPHLIGDASRPFLKAASHSRFDKCSVCSSHKSFAGKFASESVEIFTKTGRLDKIMGVLKTCALQIKSNGCVCSFKRRRSKFHEPALYKKYVQGRRG